MKIETVEEEVIIPEPNKEIMTSVENTTEPEKKGLEPVENGFEFENYKWTQNAKDVSLHIPISKNIKSKDINIDFNPTKLYVSIGNETPLFNGELFGIIKTENCTWFINDDGKKRELVVELDKKKFDEWWGCVLKGDPEIDQSKIRPPNASISDLDQETRATINKMMYDQEQKEKQGFYKDRI